MKKIKRTGTKSQYCFINHILKGVGQLAPGHEILDIIFPGNFRECGKFLKESYNGILNIDKNCRAKCNKNKNKK